ERNAVELAEVNERIMRDLDAAARIQRAFLPTVPAEVPGFRFAWTFKPCDRLAGDFLNVFWLDDRHLGLCVLGVGEHGIAAALLSVTASHLLARIANPLLSTGADRCASATEAALLPPRRVAGELNKHFSEAAVGQPFTFLYGILALATGEFRFVSAGHPGPVRVPPDASPVLVEVNGFPVGVGTGS